MPTFVVGDNGDGYGELVLKLFFMVFSLPDCFSCFNTVFDAPLGNRDYHIVFHKNEH